MFKKYLELVSIIVISFASGFILSYTLKNKIEVKTGIDTVTNIINIHDTVFVKADTVKIYKIKNVSRETNKKFDSLSGKLLSASIIQNVQDSLVCLGFDTIINKNYLRADVCGEFSTIPTNLHAFFTFAENPDTVKKIIRVDTLKLQNANSNSLKNIFLISSISLLAGIFAGIAIKR